MDLIILVLGIALVGFIVWGITTYIPMPPIFKTIIYILCAVVLLLFVIRQFSGSVPNVLR
jgi:hypothetical protein